MLLIAGLLFWVTHNAASQKETNPLLITKPSPKRTIISNYLSYLFCTNDFRYSLIGAKACAFTIEPLPILLNTSKDKSPVTYCNSDNFLFRAWKSKVYISAVVFEFINKKSLSILLIQILRYPKRY